MKCPRCGVNWRQMKAGFNHSGSQRYKCGDCKTAYTPASKEKGRSQETRLPALRMYYVEGSSQWSITRILKVSPQSSPSELKPICQVAACPKPQPPKVAELLDELYTFLKQKKNKIYILTVVNRATHWLFSWEAVSERNALNVQACLEHARKPNSTTLTSFQDTTSCTMTLRKKGTYSVEALNAGLRHYLKCLARKSRCFSRRLDALLKNLHLFAYCYNQRQFMNHAFPQYNLPLIDFLPPL